MSHTIPVLEKSLDLIQALVETDEGATSADLQKRLSLSPSTCYRILQTLVARDWLRVKSAGRFSFSTGLLPLLKPLTDYQRMFDHLAFPLEGLVADTGLTAKISVKQGGQAVTVYRVESPRGLSPNSKVGASFPLAYGSSGSALLAGLEDAQIQTLLDQSPPEVWRLQTPSAVWTRIKEVRKTGTCYDPGQFQTPVHGVSSPVFGEDGRIFAAVTAVGWADDFTKQKLSRLKKWITSCAADCSATLAKKPTT